MRRCECMFCALCGSESPWSPIYRQDVRVVAHDVGWRIDDTDRDLCPDCWSATWHDRHATDVAK